MADIAELGFKVNSKPIADANRELEKLPGSAAKAEASVDKLNKKTGAIRGAFGAAVAGIGSFGKGVASLAGRLPSITSMLNAGAASFRRFGGAAQTASDQVQLMQGNTANMAAQFQDIGVTAAMGMSPMMIALQQGTQLAAVLQAQGGGAAGAIKGLGAAFASVISPVSLVTIGLIGLLAAGLQAVQWGKVFETVLDGLADILPTIAPYLVGIAAGLALIYAPAILTGIAAVSGALAGLAVQAVKTGAAMIAANPIGALILGLTAAVTALVIFRDEITEIVGVDVVGVVQMAGNKIIGVFVGAYEAVKQAWSNLPNFFSGIGKRAWNSFLETFEQPALTINGQVVIPGFDMSGAKAQLTEAEKSAFNDASVTMGDALDRDYIGTAVTAIQHGASGAADALRALADETGKWGQTTEEAGSKAESAYARTVRGAQEFIASQQLEAQTLGMSELQANKMRYAQELLNQAYEQGKTLTEDQRNELYNLAGVMATVEDNTKRLTEAYEFGKSTFTSFLQNFRSELMAGTSLWDAFRSSAVKALDTIASRLLDMAANNLFNMVFGGLMGGFGGASRGFIPGITGPRLFADGGYTGNGSISDAAGIVHGQEFVMNAQATRAIGVGTLQAINDNHVLPANDNGGGFVYQDNRSYDFSGTGLTADEIRDILEQDRAELLASFPDLVREVQHDPRKRVVKAA